MSGQVTQAAASRPIVMLCMPELEKKVSLKKSAIYELIKDEGFPRPRKLGGASRWIEFEIDDWLVARPAAEIKPS